MSGTGLGQGSFLLFSSILVSHRLHPVWYQKWDEMVVEDGSERDSMISKAWAWLISMVATFEKLRL